MKTNIYNIIKKSIRENAAPGIILWIFAIFILALYYFYLPSRIVFDYISNLKKQYGIVYALMSTAVFAGLIPYTYLLIAGKLKNNKFKDFLFYIFFWAWRGAEVDLLYRFQAWLFGDETTVSVLVKKVLVDQFGYSAFWAIPIMAIFYNWKACGYNFRDLQYNSEFFKIHIPPMLISCWLVWIPAVTIVYALPLSLQVPMFNIVLCFFVLLIEIINRESEKKQY